MTTLIARDGAGPYGTGPAHSMMARLAASVRGSVTVVAGVCAVLGLAPPVTLGWLIPALIVLVGWTAVYVRIAWAGVLSTWHITIDLALATGLCLAIGRLVPDKALADGTSWVSNIASLTVISAQLSGRLAVSVPAGLLVAGSFVYGSRLADAPGGGINVGVTIAIQTVISAAVMAVVLQTARAAAHAFADLQDVQRRAEIGRAGRADELAQLRLLHNGPLTTLTMAIHANGRQPSELLRLRAAANLETLRRLAAAPTGDRSAEVRLDERLAQVVLGYEPPLTVSATLSACSVPEAIGDAFADAVAEALENVVRHAGTSRAAVDLYDREGLVHAAVSDDGHGFDLDDLPEHRFGIRQVIQGQMSGVGATAAVQSAPGEGTVVRLEWRRD